jgi:hypothetical protein
VESWPWAAPCTAACLITVPWSARVRLNAISQEGLFRGWSGDCRGFQCSIQATRPSSVAAHFAEDPIRLRWIRTVAGSCVIVGKLLAGPGGKFVLAGAFEGQVSGGQGHHLSSHGKFDSFVMSFDRQGNLLWTRSLGSPGDDVVIDARANTRSVAVTVEHEQSISVSNRTFPAGALLVDMQERNGAMNFATATAVESPRVVSSEDGNTVIVGEKNGILGTPNTMRILRFAGERLVSSHDSVEEAGSRLIQVIADGDGFLYVLARVQRSRTVGDASSAQYPYAYEIVHVAASSGELLAKRVLKGMNIRGVSIALAAGGVAVVGRHKGTCSLGDTAIEPKSPGWNLLAASLSLDLSEIVWHREFGPVADEDSLFVSGTNNVLIGGIADRRLSLEARTVGRAGMRSWFVMRFTDRGFVDWAGGGEAGDAQGLPILVDQDEPNSFVIAGPVGTHRTVGTHRFRGAHSCAQVFIARFAM